MPLWGLLFPFLLLCNSASVPNITNVTNVMEIVLHKEKRNCDKFVKKLTQYSLLTQTIHQEGQIAACQLLSLCQAQQQTCQVG